MRPEGRRSLTGLWGSKARREATLQDRYRAICIDYSVMQGFSTTVLNFYISRVLTLMDVPIAREDDSMAASTPSWNVLIFVA